MLRAVLQGVGSDSNVEKKQMKFRRVVEGVCCFSQVDQIKWIVNLCDVLSEIRLFPDRLPLELNQSLISTEERTARTSPQCLQLFFSTVLFLFIGRLREMK